MLIPELNRHLQSTHRRRGTSKKPCRITSPGLPEGPIGRGPEPTCDLTLQAPKACKAKGRERSVRAAGPVLSGVALPDPLLLQTSNGALRYSVPPPSGSGRSQLAGGPQPGSDLFPGNILGIGVRKPALEFLDMPVRDWHVLWSGGDRVPGLTQKFDSLLKGEAEDFQ